MTIHGESFDHARCLWLGDDPLKIGTRLALACEARPLGLLKTKKVQSRIERLCRLLASQNCSCRAGCRQAVASAPSGLLRSAVCRFIERPHEIRSQALS